MNSPRLSWHSASRTDVGKLRKLNEDAAIARPEIGLWAVADGMGGHTAGDVASQMLVEALGTIKPVQQLSEFVDFVEYHVLDVNKRLFDLGQSQNQTCGTTIVALLAIGRFCVYLWAGDSRLYRLRDGQLEQLTTDHSQVELYIEQGLIERQDAANFHTANRITRAVGASDRLYLDIDIAEIRPGDRFLLCSDGLDRHVKDEEISEVLSSGTPDSVSDDLIELTLRRGARDNVTVCIVDMDP